MNKKSKLKKELIALISSLTGCEVAEHTLIVDLPVDDESDDFAIMLGNCLDISIFSCQSALQSSQTVGEFVEKII